MKSVSKLWIAVAAALSLTLLMRTAAADEYVSKSVLDRELAIVVPDGYRIKCNPKKKIPLDCYLYLPEMEQWPEYGKNLVAPWLAVRIVNEKSDYSVDDFIKFKTTVFQGALNSEDYLEMMKRSYVEYTRGEKYYESSGAACFDSLIVNDDTQGEDGAPYLRGKELSRGVCFVLARGLLVQLNIYKPYDEVADSDAMRRYSVKWLNKLKEKNLEGME